MCGIFGLTNGSRVAASLMQGLQALEYRGYDSAGLATLRSEGIECRRAQGKLRNLRELVERQPLDGTTGIAHTRWATHGRPSVGNAHPHTSGQVAVVHNGIIENHRALRDRLAAQGHRFASETDSEVIPHLIDHYLQQGLSPTEAIRAAVAELEGSYALGIVIAGEENRLYATRRGSPLVLGVSRGAGYLASDAVAIGPLASHILYLEDGDCAILEKDEVGVLDEAGHEVMREHQRNRARSWAADRGGFAHYMLKEIHEQPGAMRHTLAELDQAQSSLPAFDALDRLRIVACGTSYYAGLLAKYWFESLAGLATDVEIASEFRYRTVPARTDEATLFISQSGETADTLAALRHARGLGNRVLSIVNVENSSIARGSDSVLYTRAGPEIGVASTKSFTAQITALAALALRAGRERGVLTPEQATELDSALRGAPQRMEAALQGDARFAAVAEAIHGARDVIYLGRGECFPLALEAALKLKEISYIHAEGFAAGEMKHGPIALIDPKVPVLVFAPPHGLFDKTAANIREITARGGRVFVLSDSAGERRIGDEVEGVISLPVCHPFQVPFVYAVALQLIAYHTARLRGNDVDQPRNLAKSVTVE